MKIKHIECKRWFQRSYGNTYNSVKIYLDNGKTVTLSKDYGYGDYCLQRAEEWIQANCNYANPDKLTGTRFLREIVGASYSIIDVPRQKDLD